MANSFDASFGDVQSLHRLPGAEMRRNCPTRFRTLLRQQRDPERLPRAVLCEGQSRFDLAEFVGAGTDGVVLRVASRAYYERRGPCAAMHEFQSNVDAVVKIRELYSSFSRVTLTREIFMGVLVRHRGIPFVSGMRRWWLWDGVEQRDRMYGAAGISNRLRQTGQLPINECDITDFLSPDVQRRVRANYAGVASSNSCRAVDDAYTAKRAQDLARRVQQQGGAGLRVYAVLEVDAAGSRTLDDVLTKEHIFSTRRCPHGWTFFRAMMLTLGQQLHFLQRHYSFIHGDCSTSNIVLSQHAQKPYPFLGFQTFEGGAFCPLEARHLAATAGGPGLFPTFIDLSRSAVCAEHLVPHLRPDRAASFDADAWRPLDGYVRTGDIRRLGLSLSHTLMRALFSNDPALRVPIDEVDWRMVDAIRFMLDGAPCWATLDDFTHPRTSNWVAKSTTLHHFFSGLLYLVDTLRIVSCAARRQERRVELWERVTSRYQTWMTVWNVVNYDLNNWLGWALARYPAMEEGDARLPELFVNWDVWRQ